MNIVKKTIKIVTILQTAKSQIKYSSIAQFCPSIISLTNPIHFHLSTRRRTRNEMNQKQKAISRKSEQQIQKEIKCYSMSGQHDKVIQMSLTLLKQYLSTNKIERPKYLQELLSLSYYAINTKNYLSAQHTLLELHTASKQQTKNIQIEDDQIPYMLGYLYTALKKFEVAKNYYEQVLQTEKAKTDEIFNACVNTEIIKIHHKLNQIEQALQKIPYCEKILMSETVSDDKIAQVCSGLLTLSQIQNCIGNKRNSLQKLERSIELLSKVKDFNIKVIILQTLIEVNTQLGFPHESSELLEQTINLLSEQKSLNEKQGNTNVLNPIQNLILWNEKGTNYQIILSNSTKIEHYLKQNNLQNHLIQANLKYQKGRSHYKLNNHKESESNFKKAFEQLEFIQRSDKDCKFMQGRCLAYQALNKHQENLKQQAYQDIEQFISHVEKYELSNHKTDQIKYLHKHSNGQIDETIAKIKDLIKENHS